MKVLYSFWILVLLLTVPLHSVKANPTGICDRNFAVQIAILQQIDWKIYQAYPFQYSPHVYERCGSISPQQLQQINNLGVFVEAEGQTLHRSDFAGLSNLKYLSIGTVSQAAYAISLDRDTFADLTQLLSLAVTGAKQIRSSLLERLSELYSLRIGSYSDLPTEMLRAQSKIKDLALIAEDYGAIRKTDSFLPSSFFTSVVDTLRNLTVGGVPLESLTPQQFDGIGSQLWTFKTGRYGEVVDVTLDFNAGRVLSGLGKSSTSCADAQSDILSQINFLVEKYQTACTLIHGQFKSEPTVIQPCGKVFTIDPVTGANYYADSVPAQKSVLCVR
jgi:hypothetical protein